MRSSWFRLGCRFSYLFVASVYSYSKEGSTVSRRALKVAVIFLCFSYYGTIGAKLNGQGEPCTKFMLLLA